VLYVCVYRVVSARRNWQIETAGWNWAGLFTEDLVTRWQRFGQFLNDLWKQYSGIWPVSSLWVQKPTCSDLGSFLMIGEFFYENLNFLCKNLKSLHENLRFSLRKILVIFSIIFLMIHKISCYKLRASTGVVENCWLCGRHTMKRRTD